MRSIYFRSASIPAVFVSWARIGDNVLADTALIATIYPRAFSHNSLSAWAAGEKIEIDTFLPPHSFTLFTSK